MDSYLDELFSLMFLELRQATITVCFLRRVQYPSDQTTWQLSSCKDASKSGNGIRNLFE